MFKSQKLLDKKHIPVIESLMSFYTPEMIREVLIPLISSSDGKEGVHISLRALNWLVTNYAKKYPILYKVKPPGMSEKVINIHSEYKTWLWKYRRTQFDPFRRRQRLMFELDGESYTTTVGQLNFMYWAYRYGVLRYAQQHIQEIEEDQNLAILKKRKHQQEEGKNQRRKLSSVRKVVVFKCSTTIQFNPVRR